jgi:shikimate kinase
MSGKMRIYIVGGPGSGKTTLAKWLSQQLSHPFYEMDVIGWENGHGAARPLETRLADIQQITNQAAWICEGGGWDWTEELYQVADHIVWLDLPWRIAAWRIVSRHMRASLAGTNRHSGLLKLWRFLRYARGFYLSKDPTFEGNVEIVRKLRPFMHKVVRCHRPAEVEAFVARMLLEARTTNGRMDYHKKEQ